MGLYRFAAVFIQLHLEIILISMTRLIIFSSMLYCWVYIIMSYSLKHLQSAYLNYSALNLSFKGGQRNRL